MGNVPSIWLTHHSERVGNGVVPTHTQSPTIYPTWPLHGGPQRVKTGPKLGVWVFAPLPLPCFQAEWLALPNLGREHHQGGALWKWQRLLSGHLSSGPLNLTLSSQSGDLGHPTRGKQVVQELALLQAARRYQSPLWAVTSSCSHWYNYLTLGCMC